MVEVNPVNAAAVQMQRFGLEANRATGEEDSLIDGAANPIGRESHPVGTIARGERRVGPAVTAHQRALGATLPPISFGMRRLSRAGQYRMPEWTTGPAWREHSLPTAEEAVFPAWSLARAAGLLVQPSRRV